MTCLKKRLNVEQKQASVWDMQIISLWLVLLFRTCNYKWIHLHGYDLQKLWLKKKSFWFSNPFL